jgi:hypothetical protein
VLVETPHEKGQPAAVAFEKGDPQFGVAVQNSAAAKTTDGEHLFDGMSKSMAQHEIVAELFTDLARRRSVRLVKTERYAEIFERRPKRLVKRIVPIMAVDDVGAQKDGPKAQLLDTAPSLSYRIIDVEGRYHSGADELARIGPTKFIEPIVVGARERGGEVTIQGRDAQHVQPAARVENR